jgi:hypothetical protein
MLNSDFVKAGQPPNIVYAGYGYGIFPSDLIYNSGITSHFALDVIGPFYLKYEHKITKATSLGINIAWLEENYSLDYVDSSSATYIRERDKIQSHSIIMRFNHMILEKNNFQLFVGTGIGYRNNSRHYRNEVKRVYILENVPHVFPFAFEFTIGERLFITENLGVSVEVGIAKSIFQGGIVYAF